MLEASIDHRRNEKYYIRVKTNDLVMVRECNAIFGWSTRLHLIFLPSKASDDGFPELELQMDFGTL